MKTIQQALLALLFIMCTNAFAAPYSGVANVYDPVGNPFPIFFNVPISGDIDIATDLMTLDPPPIFLGTPLLIDDVSFFDPGSYAVIDSLGDTQSIEVGPGQVGALMDLQWGAVTFPVVMVWDVIVPIGGGIGLFLIADSDGDGIPGQAIINGPFPGISFTFDRFGAAVGPPQPGIVLRLLLPGGATQECAETGGSTVTVTALAQPLGGAVLDRVEWAVDGNGAGTGISISPFLDLGAHTIDATAYTTTGESDSDSVDVTVRDTTRPVFTASFVDAHSGEVLTEVSGPRAHFVTVSLDADDVCDPAPVSSGTLTPVFAVEDGDTIKIQGNNNAVDLPVSAIELRAHTLDASGNGASTFAVLPVTD